jgi:glycosyltransferase involved in cell wall biosynthesis
MRILLFHQYFLGKSDPGGSRWNQLTHYFSGDHTITVLAGNVHYATGKKVLPRTFINREQVTTQITLYRSWTYSGYNANFIGRLLGYVSYTASSFFTGLFLKKHDIIIVTSPPLFIGLSALLLSGLRRVPFLFEVRDLWPESAVSTGVTSNRLLISVMYRMEHLLYKKARKIVVLTPAFKQNIEDRYPQYSDKLDVITNGADLELMQPGSRDNWVREKHAWGEKNVFSYFGAHGLANDLEQVVDVARELRDNTDILFVLIGDGMQKNALIALSEKLELSNVQFIDSVAKNEVMHYINASDVCMAILKKSDTFKTVYPNKVFDYMACRKPVLVTIDGITRDLIEQARCGYFSEPGNITEFKQTVLKMASLSASEKAQLGERGYVYVRKHFDRSHLAGKYLSLISNIEN